MSVLRNPLLLSHSTPAALPYRDPDLPVGACPKIVFSLKRWLPDFIRHLPTDNLRSELPYFFPSTYTCVCITVVVCTYVYTYVCVCVCIWCVCVHAHTYYMCVSLCIYFTRVHGACMHVFVYCLVNLSLPIHPLGDFVVRFLSKCKLQNPGDISLCFFSEALSLIPAQPLLQPEGIQALRWVGRGGEKGQGWKEKGEGEV